MLHVCTVAGDQIRKEPNTVTAGKEAQNVYAIGRPA
jgi:hypothetical protein